VYQISLHHKGILNFSLTVKCKRTFSRNKGDGTALYEAMKSAT